MVTGFNHVGISVADLERSVQFYVDLLEMELVVKPQVFEGELYGRILGLAGAKGRVALLKKGTLQLELFEFSNPSPTPKEMNEPVSKYGLSHFCVNVLDIDSLHKRLRGAGVEFHCPPLDFGHAKATYGRDPEGNVFELLQKEDRVEPSER